MIKLNRSDLFLYWLKLLTSIMIAKQEYKKLNAYTTANRVNVKERLTMPSSGDEVARPEAVIRPLRQRGYPYVKVDTRPARHVWCVSRGRSYGCKPEVTG